MNYNYIFIAPDQSDINILYADFNKTTYSQYIAQGYPKIDNFIFNFLHKIHISHKINNYIHLPLKNIWDKKLFHFTLKPSLDISKQFCFIIYARYFDFLGKNRESFIKYLRSNYKDCKIILYLGDLIKSFSFDINGFKSCFDAILSFDKGESTQNNFIHYDEPFSFYPLERDLSMPQSDVTFIGYAKDRLETILNVFELLQSNNFVCDFHLVGVPKTEQVYTDKIIYNKPLDFVEVLKHVVSSKCILEVLQQEGNSPTTRISEAICYGKKLLSNCLELKTKSYYNEKYISVFTNPENIDIEFLKRDIGTVDYHYLQNLSPLCMIDYIDSHIIDL